MEKKSSSNNNLHKASKEKKDEFYTQLVDIEKELKHYKSQFRGKVVYCNCDDPFESNFFKYFASNFKELGLKRLIATSYKPSPIANTELVLQPSLLLGYEDKIVRQPVEPKGRPKVTANKFIINEVDDIDGDGAFDLRDIAEQLKVNKNNEWLPLKGEGDFRSKESIELLKQADIVVTNPPFSLFREYISQLVEYNKKFLIIGNVNSITYKECFKLIKDNKLWLGASIHSGDREFQVPDDYPLNAASSRIDSDGKKYIRVKGVRWFTNLDYEERHENLVLYKTYIPKEYPKYDNYDGINVDKTADIPVDYNGAIGVPITFLDKYNPEQFEIVKFRKGDNDKDLVINGKSPYFRIIIKKR
ncbi:MAG: adenine-specific methyltransferase EcoRI family protein [Candidatus Moranbacteria bacterium]|nr:adenine-specific methyltransferase EcoRI family protein [Candidatus Moranbacteria bacterium]MDD3964909.1 adenine-specific methyltransferase EcoRI family protein [Candidatus Moranbacteria bacterium]